MDLDTRYQFLEKIGSGSFATVYRARDDELGREVAIKQIHGQYLDDPKQLDRYWQEALLLASLGHPNIVTIFDIYRDRGWLILELMQTNLAERMAGRQMDLRAIRTTLAHCLRALKYLHSRGIVHGDIKPSNMMIDARRRVKIGDFGLARRVSDEEGSLLKGTTKYMAPEVVTEDFGDVGPGSDLYSLGFSAYELICGPNFESLFPGLSAFGRNKQIAWMMWHAAADRRLPDIHRVLEGVPDDLAGVIQKLVVKDQSQRYQTADDALADLNIDVRMVKSNDSAEQEQQQQVEQKSRRNRLLMACGAFAASFILCLLVLFWPTGESIDPNAANLTYGVVREVVVDRNSLVIEDIETGIPEEFLVGKRPRIFFQNTEKNILLRELKPGDRVEIEKRLAENGKVVLSIRAARPVSNWGRIKSIDEESARVVIAIEEGENRDDLPLRVPKRAEILLNGHPVKLRDLKDNDRARVTHLPEAGGKGGRVVDSLSCKREKVAVGFVASLDQSKGRLTVKFGRGSTSGSITLPLAAKCRITLQGKGSAAAGTLKPADLAEDDRIRFWYDTEFQQIVVTRDKRQTSGVVQQVRTDAAKLLVSTSDGKEFVFHVEASAEVSLSLESATLADLRKYDTVEITYDDTNREHLLVSTIFATRPIKSDRWAIIIGPESYNDKFLTPVPYLSRNATLFQETLTKRYAFSEERMLLLRRETRDQMQSEIVRLLGNARRQTQVLVYVSCHAYVGDDGRVYLAGKYFNWDRMSETGLPLDWLIEQLESCASKDKILLFDCTHKGRGKDLERQPSSAAMLETLKMPLKSTFAIASCRNGERGLPWKNSRHGLFAHFLADAFAGRADRDRNLRVSADEAFEYLQSSVPKAAAQSGGSQSPLLISPQ